MDDLHDHSSIIALINFWILCGGSIYINGDPLFAPHFCSIRPEEGFNQFSHFCVLVQCTFQLISIIIVTRYILTLYPLPIFSLRINTTRLKKNYSSTYTVCVLPEALLPWIMLQFCWYCHDGRNLFVFFVCFDWMNLIILDALAHWNDFFGLAFGKNLQRKYCLKNHQNNSLGVPYIFCSNAFYYCRWLWRNQCMWTT